MEKKAFEQALQDMKTGSFYYVRGVWPQIVMAALPPIAIQPGSQVAIMIVPIKEDLVLLP